jgi:serine/threonine protein kinase
MNPILAMFGINSTLLTVLAFFAVIAIILAILLLLAALAFAVFRHFENKKFNSPPSRSPASTFVLPQRKCPQCGAELKPDAPEGLCPACLLKRGIATEGGAPPGTPPFTPPPLAELVKLFPQLEILEPVGQGGMGAVYKARQPALDRLVALKILAPRSGGDVDFAERFTREARALAKLSHPNIVAVYDFGRTELPPGQNAQQPTPALIHYFIMEYVDGLNLRQLEQAGKLQPQEALQIVPQICAALQFAHDEGIVHRDIKPENILLDKKGRVKIADFGLAKITGLEAKDFRLTGARDVMGTPHYMAPEQVEHPQAVDHRADIYSLGVVFYEMLTGELPLGKFAPPSQKVHVDVRLDEVVLRSLEKEPSRRYQQASEVKTEVETISSSKPDSKPGVRRKKLILPFILGAGIICVLLVAALLSFHENLPKSLTIRAYIDGSDLFTVRGNNLAIQHENFDLPGKTIFINGKAWTPKWHGGISSEFTGLKPAFKPRDLQSVQITKYSGRGTIRIEQLPSAENNNALTVQVSDDDFGGADWYDFRISWDMPPKSGTTKTREHVEKDTASIAASQSAMPVVQAWLKLMDDGDYAQSWETAADSFHDAITKTQWVATSKQVRQPLGQVWSRKLSSTAQPTTLPGMPHGSYFVVKFDTAFENFKPAVETVTFALTDDGQWKAIAYLIQPGDNAPNPAVAGENQAAVSAAEKWLTEIDNGDYAQSWEDSSAVARNAATKKSWMDLLKVAREPLGALRSRKLKSAQHFTQLPGAPVGQYVVMQFETSFANKKSATETVTFMRENGQWKSAGYFIK